MRIGLITLILICLPGCGGGCGKTFNKINPFAGKSDEEKAQELAAKVAKFKEADKIVAKWAAHPQLQQHQGFTEMDPWGKPIQISFEQNWTKEIAVIRSAGPDGTFGTEDDLVRQKSYENASNVLSGLPKWMYFVGIWMGLGLLAYIFASLIQSTRRKRGSNKQREHPLAFALGCMLFGPFSILFYGFMGLGMAVAAITGSDFDFGGFDFDLGDLDF